MEVKYMEQYLEFSDIGKAFPGVQALKDISFRVTGGKVLALIGENGAGKSTLLKILSGDLKPDEGYLSINGEKLTFDAPSDSLNAGISVIYQERQLVPTVSVMENIYAGELPLTKIGLYNKSQLKKQAQVLIDKFGLPIDPTSIVGFLPVAYQQMVEVIKAYRCNSQVIAFDEPTAPLTDKEITILFKLIQQLKEEGKIVLYVSHRLNEIFQVSDEIVVLKDGRLVKTLSTPETNENELIKAMVGRDIGDTYSKLSRNEEYGDVVLEVNHLTTHIVSDISFKLRKGEIVGFAGLVGAGRTEVAQALFGVDTILSGEVKVDGKKVRFKSPKQAIDCGIALCPEDRKEQGLILWRSIKDNICMPVLGKLKNGIFIDEKAKEALALAAIEKYSIKTTNIDKTCVELSGGNQQKVILGRWTSEKIVTKILILDEPTKGIDVGTKAEIYQVMCDFAKQGIGVIFISSELTEVLNVADTIIVMHNGHITGKISRQDATEESVLAMAMLD
jgi:L-arabinose transport system ATP-binding protein